MKHCIAALVLLVAASSFHTIASEDDFENDAKEKRIYIGQSMRDVYEILDDTKLPHGVGGYAFAKTPDQSNLYVKIDPNHADACIFYSESKQKVTGIQMVFFYSAKSRSKSEPMVPATSITFAGHGGYTVDFCPPEKQTHPATGKNGALTPQLPPSR